MLVLSRKVGEKLVIGDNVTVTINRISGNRVTIGIEAPGSVKIVRGELERHDAPVLASTYAGSAPAEANIAIAHRHQR